MYQAHPAQFSSAQFSSAPARPAPAAAPPVPSDDTRTLAALAYLTALLGLPMLGPFLLLVTRGKAQPEVRWHAWQAMLLQIAVLIETVVLVLGVPIVQLAMDLAGVELLFGMPALVMPLPLTLFLWLTTFVVQLWAAVRAGRGRVLRLPMLASLADRFARWSL